jgi:hypothetical protein
MIIEILFTCGVKHHQTNKQICYVLTLVIGFMPKYLVQAHWNNNHYGSYMNHVRTHNFSGDRH